MDVANIRLVHCEQDGARVLLEDSGTKGMGMGRARPETKLLLVRAAQDDYVRRHSNGLPCLHYASHPIGVVPSGITVSACCADG